MGSHCHAYLPHPSLVGGAPLSMVEHSHRYSPSPPSHLRMEDGVLYWDPVPCVSHYRVTHTVGGREMRRRSELSHSVILWEGWECGRGRLEVRAVSGRISSPGSSINYTECTEEETEADREENEDED